MGENTKAETVVDAEIVYDDPWQKVEDAARKVEAAAGHVLEQPERQRVQGIASKVQYAARVGREVQHLAGEVGEAVSAIQEKIDGLSFVRHRTHPRNR